MTGRLSDPGQCTEQIVDQAYNDYKKAHPPKGMFEMPQIPPFMFNLLFRAGWEYSKAELLVPTNGKLPNDEVLRKRVERQPIPLIPVDRDDIFGSFKAGAQACIKAAKEKSG